MNRFFFVFRIVEARKPVIFDSEKPKLLSEDVASDRFRPWENPVGLIIEQNRIECKFVMCFSESLTKSKWLRRTEMDFNSVASSLLLTVRWTTIPHKNYETAHMKERLCLPSPLQSNCDKVQILLNSRSFNFQHCLQGGRGATKWFNVVKVFIS